jgi:hypothetical protein
MAKRKNPAAVALRRREGQRRVAGAGSARSRIERIAMQNPMPDVLEA